MSTPRFAIITMFVLSFAFTQVYSSLSIYHQKLFSPSNVENIGHIFYLSADKRSIRKIQPDGTHDSLIALLPRLVDSEVVFSVSPKGGQILVLQYNYANNSITALLIRNGAVTRLNIPQLEMNPVRWSPDETSFLGTLAVPDQLGDRKVYLYNIGTRVGRELPITGVANWGTTNDVLIFSTITAIVQRPDETRPRPMYDLYQYTLSTGARQRLTYLHEAVIEFPNGRKGTDFWSIYDVRTSAEMKSVLFLGVPEHAKSSAGTNTLAWYRVPLRGLARGDTPDYVGNGNRDIALNPRNANEFAVTGSHHNSACSNPGYILVERRQSAQYSSIVAPLRKPERAEAVILGVTYSPDGSQIAYGFTYYTCNSNNSVYAKSPKIYIWDIPKDFSTTEQLGPRFLVDGSDPIWRADIVQK